MSSSIDGTHLVSGGRDCTMAVRDVESGEELPGLDVINNGINSTQFIPDDKWLSSEQRRPAHPGLEPGQQRSAL